MRTRTRTAIVAALLLGASPLVAGCGSSADPGSAKFCGTGSAWTWYFQYAAGEHGGPAQDSYVAQKVMFKIAAELKTLEHELPSSQAKDAAAVRKTVVFDTTYYQAHSWALSNGQYKKMLQQAPKSKQQHRRLIAWLQSKCSTKGSSWPARPTDAGKVLSSS